MKQLLLAAFLAASVFHQVLAQSILPANRRVDWSRAGYGNPTPVYNPLNILYFGADNNGSTSCNAALQAAISSLYGQPGTIFFPAGTYFFNQPVTLPSGVVLKGKGRTETKLIFNLTGANNDLISIAGSMQATSTLLTAAADKEATVISVNNTAGFAAGDYVRLSQNDASMITSSWALGTVGQLVKINSISGNTITLQSPLRKAYSLTEVPKLTKMQPATGSGVECLSIKRLDATSGQTANIRIENAAQCWVKNIESDSSNFAHINITTATNIEVTGNYFHGAFGYGGNGQGYGVVLQSTSGECLVENNAFRHLRHSMILQSGANGNVLAYNYSTQPYWSDVSPMIPMDAAGDMVLHGNWPYANLFESNQGQNIVIDNSHGANGPFNTFFRNRGANYGLLMNNGAGDSSNLIGNEITHATNGYYLLTGTGNFEWGNNVKGNIVPALTSNLAEASLYDDNRPEYFTPNYDYPAFGPPDAMSSSNAVPASAIDSIGNGCCCNTVSVILPIILQQFSATSSGCNALLSWSATDDATDSYTLESSIDNFHFSVVKKIPAKGGAAKNTYSLTLEQTAASVGYRLKMTDRDGSILYSSLRQVSSACKTKNSLAVMPNPVGNTMNLQVSTSQSEKLIISITDATGKTVSTTRVQVQAGTNYLPMNAQMLLPGIYHISIRKSSGEMLCPTQKVVKGVMGN